MRSAISWTPRSDAMVCAARAAGLSWVTIANRIGVSRTAVLVRGRSLGLTRKAAPRVTPETLIPPGAPHRLFAPGVPARPPLPPGDAVTWGAITLGTLLEGSPYPHASLDVVARAPRDPVGSETALASSSP